MRGVVGGGAVGGGGGRSRDASVEPSDATAAAAASSSQADASRPPAKKQKKDAGPKPAAEDALTTSEGVLRLVGRTLALVLRLGDGYHVSDRLPSFVLQYLMTENCLNTDQEVFDAIAEWCPETSNAIEVLRSRSLATYREEVGLEPDEPLRLCDVLANKRMQIHGCQLPRTRADRDLKQISMSLGKLPDETEVDGCSACAVLTDENKHALLVDCVKHHLRFSRGGALRALHDGFTGADKLQHHCSCKPQDRHLQGRDDNCYNWCMQLQNFTPAEFALRIRGREIAAVGDAWKHVWIEPQAVQRKPRPFDATGTKFMDRPSDAEVADFKAWFEPYCTIAKDLSWIKDLLIYATGKPTFRAFEAEAEPTVKDDDRDAITIELYKCVTTNGPSVVDLPTASTCTRTILMPIASQGVLIEKLEAALDEDRQERKTKGGAAFGFS